MTSKASDVETYLRDVPEERRASLTTLRNLCSRVLTGYEEGIDYGMPVYKRNGSPEVAFASQKQYIALYVMKKDVLDKFRESLSATSIGKGCIRFSKPERMDFAVIERMLRRIVESESVPG